MKQIIVNVNGLSAEEKQRVNEALAKVMGVSKMSFIHSNAELFFAPASSGRNTVTWDWQSLPKTPTHTPQQVMEMAGMAGMAEKRKVRADFDLTKEYSVDVSNCTIEEKKAVQRAFFNLGIVWAGRLADYGYFDANQFISPQWNPPTPSYLLLSMSSEGSNMTAKEFLNLVYEDDMVEKDLKFSEYLEKDR